MYDWIFDGQVMLSLERELDDDVLLKPEKTKIKPPSKYAVLLLNDDFTTMEFVIILLRKFFSMDEEQATRIMLEIHTKGQAICGVFTRDIAETKVALVNKYAREHEYPLLCKMKKMD